MGQSVIIRIKEEERIALTYELLPVWWTRILS